MKRIVIYTDTNGVVYSEDVPSKKEYSQAIFDEYLQDNAIDTMTEYDEKSCKIAVIDFENDVTFIAHFEQEITVKLSRTDL